MGSGETAPTMTRIHRRLMQGVGVTAPSDAVLLDTPYGFQENAPDISARAQEYFRRSVGHPITVAGWRGTAADDDTVVRERALAAVADASYVFAGPGSPTYALQEWRGTPLPSLLADKFHPGTFRSGGAVTFASAAALTLGAVSVPVYEVYKVGMRPFWAEGMDLLSDLGLHVAVIPHYGNKEGGNHDTRFCYLGERRLSMLEPELPSGAWVLGVDEHTALVLDLDEGTATVEGNGTVTVRRAGESEIFPAGSELSLDDLRPGSGRGTVPPAEPTTADVGAPEPNAGIGLSADVARLTETFDAALADRDPERAVGAILELEQAIVDWSADTLQSDETNRARGALRRMVVRLGEVAAVGARDPREVIAPFVDAVLEAREAVRAAHRYDLADRLRDALLGAGVEVRDTPGGTEWRLPQHPPG